MINIPKEIKIYIYYQFLLYKQCKNCSRNILTYENNLFCSPLCQINYHIKNMYLIISYENLIYLLVTIKIMLMLFCYYLSRLFLYLNEMLIIFIIQDQGEWWI